VIALDANGIAQSRITAEHAADLLTSPARNAQADSTRAAPQKSNQAKAGAHTLPSAH
jgi:hypothetical protein